MTAVVVVQRLAHAHQNQVAQALLRIDGVQNPPGVQDLRDDFPRPQMADEAHLPGRAKHTAHRATGLGAHADRVPSVVAHQHRLDGLAVAQAQQEFSGQPVGAADFVRHLRGIEEKRFSLAHRFGDPALERRQEITRCQIQLALAMDGAPQGLGVMQDHPVTRQHLRQLGESEIVQRSLGQVAHAGMQPRADGRSSVDFPGYLPFPTAIGKHAA